MDIHSRRYALLLIGSGLMLIGAGLLIARNKKTLRYAKIEPSPDWLKDVTVPDAPAWDYDREKYAGKIMEPVNLPDGTYSSGWTGYSLYVDAPGGVIQLKTDVGIICPFPVHSLLQVTSGQGFILQQEKDLPATP